LEQSTNHQKFEGARQQQNCHGVDLSLFFLQTNPSLHFMLKVRQFIEMVSGQDTATDEDSTAIIRLDSTENNSNEFMLLLKKYCAVLTMAKNLFGFFFRYFISASYY
jgi:hypothetical protein